jgi:hypothetical protein
MRLVRTSGGRTRDGIRDLCLGGKFFFKKNNNNLGVKK